MQEEALPQVLGQALCTAALPCPASWAWMSPGPPGTRPCNVPPAPGGPSTLSLCCQQGCGNQDTPLKAGVSFVLPGV